MNLTTLRALTLSLIVLLFQGCNVVKEIGGVYNMTQCKYNYRSITGLTLSGMNLSQGLSIANIAQLTSILTGQANSIPLNFTLNLDVANPNSSAALLHGLQYILTVDNIQFTTGSIEQALNIPSGGTQTLPLTIGLDLATLLKGESKTTVQNIAKNFIGIGDNPSNVSFQIRPTFMIGGYPITAPNYIPVNFTFSGMK